MGQMPETQSPALQFCEVLRSAVWLCYWLVGMDSASPPLPSGVRGDEPESLVLAAPCCLPRRWGSRRHWGTFSEGAVPVAGMFLASPGGLASLLPPRAREEQRVVVILFGA